MCFLVFFLTSEYVCVSGCNSFDLDDARLCSLPDKKRKVDVYVQHNIYPSEDAPRCHWWWTQSPVVMTTGEKPVGPGCKEKQELPRFSLREWKKWISPVSCLSIEKVRRNGKDSTGWVHQAVIRGKCRIWPALETLHFLFIPVIYAIHLLHASSIYAPLYLDVRKLKK